ncbi:putative oxidoreductase [Clostridium acetobutylicum]|uniref:Aldo/keto reductase family enzyme n=1 Tax=Clostridium acetobutylicum (strain ATCC 824 / DSM 792 / JCM 1419 / IAM 19013 / LMG 5710 / NBRC 13948 / NRRL B-527 / VKM B-1787 / 2291 / W) TaxID=272562 RepID=Q97DU3_CLOAB|nr:MULTISPECIES: aldo/keto reductase family oxidoreductase [Clostridium]AAK81309.1 Aldo/keto reductase family enzyme [Clostridium acetobutylicum ATCC 824]ADZ22418.1 Aldo/keto reductase family enzyme [Clostridium acetobutylicum EA 2018]AEI33749.1 aldo/keto reductase [Clostridium acetobutylicum DSM 1731]AWV81025.1 aldo/keto reductase family oxidoreductase [Clostridium acetobutylicum]MBC2395538.1 aldo/keto reductase family oxidoreductase [Clostridium acetobutylicum]
MKTLNIGKGELSNVSEISLGCMRLSELTVSDASKLISTALEEGINFFDHADIYGGGRCEEIFSEAIDMKPSVREKLIIQSKCGIRKGFFDFSKEHILNSVDQSLKRLKTEYLDVLLLHRPDALMEPEEVAEAFETLSSSGKVRHFGVSNQNPMQIELLSKYLNNKIIINQLQLSIMHTGMIDAGLNVNMKNEASINCDGSVLDYCRLNDITIQPWSPFQYGFFEGVFLDNDKFPELNKVINNIARDKGVKNTAIAIAWLLRHPAKMQPIVGTTNVNRLKDICKASDIELTRKEWYEIYRAAGNKLP